MMSEQLNPSIIFRSNTQLRLFQLQKIYLFRNQPNQEAYNQESSEL